jgi:hypothetical protein
MPPRVAPAAPVDPSLDQSSPYYVHPSDGPSSVVVKPLLTGSNYHSWARSMRRALGGKMKFDFVDGSIPVPIDPFDPTVRAWNRCNMLVHSWILNSVFESIENSIVFMENAIDVWNDLKERFSQGDLVRIAELQQEIYSLRQESRSVTEFFSALKILWEELELYTPIPTCTCRIQCGCQAMRSARANHNLMHVIRFLTGLNDQFDVVKSQILLMEPLPSLNKIFSMVIQHERQGNFPVSEHSKALINSANSRVSNPKSSKSGYGSTSSAKRVCTFCGKDNHTVDNCYKKHGLPPHLQKRSQAHNAVVEDSDTVSEQPSVAEPKSAGSSPMTQDQWEQLIALIHNSSSLNQGTILASSNQAGGSSNFTGHISVNPSGNVSFVKSNNLSSWIIDSGASHHICTSLTWFRSYNEIPPVSVRLPNGSLLYAKHSGTVQFSPDFVLPNVLCIPEFSINLISISSMSLFSHYGVHFNGMHCFIQDQATLKTIGSAKLVDGLYYLSLNRQPVCASAATSAQPFIIPNNAIWHFRLGHLSHNRMNLLVSKFPFVVFDSKAICDVCQFARQRKLSFTSSINKALKPFELVHFDIWGPLAIKSVNGYSYFLTVVDDYSRFTWIILMKSKAETRQHIMNFVNLVATQYESRIKIIRSDNGPEFLMSEFYNSKGIIHQTSCVESPQQNGRVERKHQHILNIGRALLFHSNLPKFFW